MKWGVYVCMVVWRCVAGWGWGYTAAEVCGGVCMLLQWSEAGWV